MSGDPRTAGRWSGVRLSLRQRFLLAVGVMLLPLVNMAVTAWRSLDAASEALRVVPPDESGRLAALQGVLVQGRVATVFALVLGTVVAVVAGRWVARAVLGPLDDVRRGAERLGAGDLSYRVGSPRTDELGQVAAAFDAMAEELERSQHDLAHGASHDPLTGLPNRRVLHRQVLARSGAVALLLIDLDDFKGVNDSLGHAVGDDVLRAMAVRLREEVPPPGLCARLGGDEFAVLLPLADATVAQARAGGIAAALRRPLPLEGREVVLDCSIGVVVATGDGAATADELLRNADLAMYAAKRAGGGRAELFVPQMHVRAVARLELEAELRRGLARGEVVPHYQPVVELDSGRLVGLEALARWQHPERGLLAPAAFIGLAEESDLILALGQQVLTRACAEVAAWLRLHPRDAFTLNVNVSARQLRDPGLVDLVAGALAGAGLPATRLTLEITESVVMDDPEACRERLEALVGLGVGIALDDFGTGYSSLGYLQRLPIRTLKVDRSFVAPLEHDADARVLAGAVLRLAETLSLTVTAEGVETAAQARVLRGLGCTTAQGYLFGRPGPLDAVPVPVPARAVSPGLPHQGGLPCGVAQPTTTTRSPVTR